MLGVHAQHPAADARVFVGEHPARLQQRMQYIYKLQKQIEERKAVDKARYC